MYSIRISGEKNKIMLKFLKKIFQEKEAKTNSPTRMQALVQADMHSHLLPALDDGVQSLEESFGLLTQFAAMGYKKMVMTPHIMGDFYKNSPENILPCLEKLRNYVKENNLEIELGAAAEYYLDEFLLEKLKKSEKLLTFGGSNNDQNNNQKPFILFETAFMSPPYFLDEAVFLMQSEGYQPVFAHPERYTYLYDNFSILDKLLEKGVLLQINLNSLGGYYAQGAQKLAEKLVQNNLISFVGTDCHHEKHLKSLEKAQKSKFYDKLFEAKLLNNSLL